ncbi:MBL fold metallo-hydrolase [Sulfurovum sp. bin170]|uniref:ribonuclease Z n=1 Tax=Sulfurovum sp. bin170 TaxID=2695268 RepID=UPI0013E0B0DD|nr:ribonuclease Z [Sulfurovum sp. bin170]NEW61500.1 MBL fold metallo-hydrolase [Sulfurovum sp. bin170]
MKIIFFGTSGGIPTRDRNVTSIGLKTKMDRWSMFDCGDGTTFQVERSSWDLSKLDSIFITHLHADHFFGVLSVLFRKDMYRESCDLTLYAPKGVKEFINNSLEITKKIFGKYSLKIVEIEEDDEIELRDMKIKVLPMRHRIPCYGFYVESMGKKIIIAGDNEEPEILKEYLQDLDLLIHEVTFKEEHYVRHRKNSMHTTAKRLGEVADKYGLKSLIVTHLSARYKSKKDVQGLYDEIAFSYKSRLYVANDFDEFEVMSELVKC